MNSISCIILNFFTNPICRFRITVTVASGKITQFCPEYFFLCMIFIKTLIFINPGEIHYDCFFKINYLRYFVIFVFLCIFHHGAILTKRNRCQNTDSLFSSLTDIMQFSGFSNRTEKFHFFFNSSFDCFCIQEQEVYVGQSLYPADLCLPRCIYV